MMQLCKIHFASAKKASVQPYIFFLIFCGAEKKGCDHTIFQMQRRTETPQKVPSRECKDPSGEKCTLRNPDAAPERQASGRVRSTEDRERE